MSNALIIFSDLINKLPAYFDALDRSLDSLGQKTDALNEQFLMLGPDVQICDGDGGALAEVSRSTEHLARIVVSTLSLSQSKRYLIRPFSFCRRKG